MYIAHAHTNVHCASKVWAHCIIVIRTLYTLHFASLYTLHFASLYTVQNASYLLEEKKCVRSILPNPQRFWKNSLIPASWTECRNHEQELDAGMSVCRSFHAISCNSLPFYDMPLQSTTMRTEWKPVSRPLSGLYIPVSRPLSGLYTVVRSVNTSQ